VAHGALLIRFAEAALGDDPAALAAARDELRRALGDAALVDAAGVVGIFDAVVKIADATGIPLEEQKAAETKDLRRTLGIGK
jgi:hypothetical protein